MRACGQGYARLQTLTSLMNIPKPMTANNYENISLKLSTAAKEVGEETMKEACEELRQAWPTINIRPHIMHFRRLVFSYTE